MDVPDDIALVEDQNGAGEPAPSRCSGWPGRRAYFSSFAGGTARVAFTIASGPPAAAWVSQRGRSCAA
jgi:hypothetical protein